MLNQADTTDAMVPLLLSDQLKPTCTKGQRHTHLQAVPKGLDTLVGQVPPPLQNAAKAHAVSGLQRRQQGTHMGLAIQRQMLNSNTVTAFGDRTVCTQTPVVRQKVGQQACTLWQRRRATNTVATWYVHTVQSLQQQWSMSVAQGYVLDVWLWDVHNPRHCFTLLGFLHRVPFGAERVRGWGLCGVRGEAHLHSVRVSFGVPLGQWSL
jgi:hypothetical protein